MRVKVYYVGCGEIEVDDKHKEILESCTTRKPFSEMTFNEMMEWSKEVRKLKNALLNETASKMNKIEDDSVEYIKMIEDIETQNILYQD